MSEPVITRADRARTLRIDGLVTSAAELPRADGPVAPHLEAAAPAPAADHATVWSGDGHFRASMPLDYVRRGEIVDGRLWVPDPPTRCWNVKDVVRIELTAGKQPDTVEDRSPGRG